MQNLNFNTLQYIRTPLFEQTRNIFAILRWANLSFIQVFRSIVQISGYILFWCVEHLEFLSFLDLISLIEKK